MLDSDNIKRLLCKALKKNIEYYDTNLVLDEDNTIHIFLKDSIINDSSLVYNDIIFSICNNKTILINERESKRNFISIDASHITKSFYYIIESENERGYKLYELYTYPKKLIKGYSILDENVLDEVLKLIIKLFENLKVLK